MSWTFIHDRLAVTATWFVFILGIWALYQRIRNRPLDSNWFGAAVIAEGVIIVQGLIGAYLYFGMGLDAALPRPFMHILYGVVAVVTLPAAWGYFNSLEREDVKSLAMAATSIFLWGILLRASSTAQYAAPQF
jgi:chromate transport protein ChrA